MSARWSWSTWWERRVSRSFAAWPTIAPRAARSQGAEDRTRGTDAERRRRCPEDEVRGPSKCVRVAMQLGAEDVDLGAAHASSERRHPRSDLRHELRARGPPRLESARVEEEPRRGAAYPVARKERIGHGKDHRRHGKLVPRTFSCGGGPGRPRCRAWEADSTSSEARKRTGEELPRTWKVGSDD